MSLPSRPGRIFGVLVLAAGAVATHTSITAVVLFGAAVALVLAWYADLVKAGTPIPS